MRYFPIFLDTKNARVVIAGSGEAALQKARLVAKSDARITVIGVDPDEGLRALAADGTIELLDRPFECTDAADASLVYGAHDDAAKDSEVAAIARAHGVPVNVVDTPALCDFITPAIVDRDPITVAIGSEGMGPVLARMIKSRIEALLPPTLGQIVRRAASLRGTVAMRVPEGAPRRDFWRRFFTAGWQDGPAAADREAEELSTLKSVEAQSGMPDKNRPVWLVGAGPGDPELMTLKARRILDEADVILFDRLVDPRILELARREARFVPVGKVPGGPAVPQDRINEILVEEARAGHRVVRLKGGDPLVFGRAEEELSALSAAGIEARIVPGITAASAAAASIGLPLTSRDRNQAVGLITARGADGPVEHDWRALAAADAAFAIYMGVGQARFVQGRLLLHGAEKSTAVTIVENASRPEELVVNATLGTLPHAIKAAGIKGPAVILVGLGRAEEIPSTIAHAEGAIA